MTKTILSRARAAVLLGACAGTFYSPEPGVPTAKVRFVATASGNTEFLRSDSVRCDAKYQGKLGWFHPGGGQAVQAARRGFDRRQGIPDGERFPPHMYSEALVETQRPFFVTVASTALSPGSISPYSAQMCVRAAELPVQTGRQYELVHVLDGPRCDLRFFEILAGAGGIERKEVALPSKSPTCTGWGTPRS